MNIKIVCVGKLKDRFYLDASEEYAKRLSRFVSLTIAEVADEKTPDTLSPAEEQMVMEKEGERLLTRIKDGEHVVALCVGGSRTTSACFAAHLEALADSGKNAVTFAIGGSLGLSKSVLARANERMSLSDMTLPHRLCRIFLLEQIYRACKINAHETYHK
ncbi:MAG: 23S rRNA (pseudouridine(1915)-N(3))-methyltransferase RlmH [Clostridia bacterium]